MKSCFDYVASHPTAAIAMAFIALLIIYFLFKQLIKLALFFILIALAIGGYYYFKDPQKMPENIRQTIRDTREKSGKLLDAGKHAYDKSKDIYEKGKELTKGASEFLMKKEEKQEKSN